MNPSPTTIEDIADIQTGYVFRGRLQETEGGNVQVIQNKDLADGHLNLDSLSTVSIPDRGKQWRVRKGDIILRTRGTDAAVAVIRQDPPRDTIAAAPLMVIRVTDTAKADPAFVAWQMAQPAAQEYLQLRAQGTSIRTISKAVVAKMPLELPAADRQQTVAEIAALAADIKRLTHTLADKEAAYINTLLTR